MDAHEPICPDCDSPFEYIFIVGWREGALSKLITDFKYKSVRACSSTLADLLDTIITADLKSSPSSNLINTASLSSGSMHTASPSQSRPIIVPLPTIGRHVRERGLDHTLLLAKKLAKLRGWSCDPLLRRATDTVQVGTKAADRKPQAAKTYELTKPLDPDKTYILLDDVWTTGASMLSAAHVLQSAGAKHLSAALLAIGKPNINQVNNPL